MGSTRTTSTDISYGGRAARRRVQSVVFDTGHLGLVACATLSGRVDLMLSSFSLLCLQLLTRAPRSSDSKTFPMLWIRHSAVEPDQPGIALARGPPTGGSSRPWTSTAMAMTMPDGEPLFGVFFSPGDPFGGQSVTVSSFEQS